MASIVPLSSAPDQSLAVALNVDGGIVSLQLRVRFNEIAGYWVLTIKDRSDNLLVDSIPMITGVYPAANLLQQHAYLKIGSAFVINASGVAADWPDSTNLGTDFCLVWDDTPTV